MQTSTDIQTLRAVTEAAAGVFAERPRRLAAVSYLTRRGIDATRLSGDWLLGYAPPGWTRLVDRLSRDFPEQALLDAGVARRSSRDTLIDVFRSRVMFGIRDANGRLAGFVGRDLSRHVEAPKYLNSGHSPLFDKGRLLYGLYEGQQGGGGGARQPVIVEGPLDVLAIAARAAGDGATDLLPVAGCGTAFTRAHAALVAEAAARHRSPVVVAMDADPAGRTAAAGAGEWLRLAGLDVRVATLPAGTDPADHLARASASLDDFRHQQGLPLVVIHAQEAVAAQGDRMQWVEGRLAAARSIVRYLATYPASYATAQVEWVADALELDRAAIRRELVTARQRQQAADHAAPTRSPLGPAVAGHGLAR